LGSSPYKGKKWGAFQEKWLRHVKSLKREALKRSESAFIPQPRAYGVTGGPDVTHVGDFREW